MADTPKEALDSLLARLHLEQLDKFLFTGGSPRKRQQRIFGGQLLGQAVNAATRTVDAGRRVHSLHAYFLRPGNPAEAIHFEVDPTRDGNSFSTRSVVARQGSRAIMNASLSFQVPERGLEHQDSMPAVPDPESLESDMEFYARMAQSNPGHYRVPTSSAIDYRMIDRADPIEHSPLPGHCGLWMRTATPVPEIPGIHESLLAYMSDKYLLNTALMPHGLGEVNPNVQTASIDHGLWYYGHFRADEWLYYQIDSPRAAGGRGFNFGKVFTRDGRLVATAVQEGLIRVNGCPPRTTKF